MKKLRILLCPDTPNWAYDNIADNIIRHNGDRFEFDRYYMAGPIGYPHVFLNQVFNLGDYDIIHFFWREDVQHLLNPETVFRTATEFNLTPDAIFEKLSRPVITSSVYDHLFLEPEQFPWRERAFSYMDAYSVSSNLLNRIYCDIPVFPDPLATLPDGVDPERFKPANLERFSETDRPLRVGWVGNSRWGNDPQRDPKGLHSILDPAIKALRSAGHAIDRHYADSTVQRRNRDEMATYYGEIDVLVCSSEIEGTPNPVLEAMASGVPVVSTEVGIVPDLLGDKQKQFMLKERSVKAMTEALATLSSDRSLLPALSAENLEQIKGWTWKETTRGWPDFWQTAYQRNRDGMRGSLKRQFLRERYAAWYTDNIKYKDVWNTGTNTARPAWSPRQAAVDWIYRTPERAAFINKLRGRG